MIWARKTSAAIYATKTTAPRPESIFTNEPSSPTPWLYTHTDNISHYSKLIAAAPGLKGSECILKFAAAVSKV